MKHNESIQPTWKKKVSVLDFLATILLVFTIAMLVTPEIFSHDHTPGDEADKREEVAGAAVALGAGLRLAVAAASLSTAPAWAPAVTLVACGLLFAGACLTFADLMDGPESEKEPASPPEESSRESTRPMTPYGYDTDPYGRRNYH